MIDDNKIHWFFYPRPSQFYSFISPRSTRRQAAYERFRTSVSWSNIARLQSSYAVKLGLAGVVLAPVVATFFLHVPSLKETEFPLQFALLFGSGLSFILSVVLFWLTCPTLLYQTLFGESRADTFQRHRLLEKLIIDEMGVWAVSRKYKIPDGEMEPLNRQDELAQMMERQGMHPTLDGFDGYGMALIEEAIFEFAKRRGIAIWAREERTEGKVSKLYRRNGPSRVLEGNRPYIVKLWISKPDVLDTTVDGVVKDEDLIIDWSDANLDFAKNIPAKGDVIVDRRWVHGLYHLTYSKESTEMFSLMVSRWQNHRRGIARLGMFLLYGMALGLFAAFLGMQTHIVLQALRWIN